MFDVIFFYFVYMHLQIYHLLVLLFKPSKPSLQNNTSRIQPFTWWYNQS